jgi:hypothetical protein
VGLLCDVLLLLALQLNDQLVVLVKSLSSCWRKST